MIKQKIDAYVEQVKEEMIAEIFRLVSFPSISGNQEENTACLRYFLGLAERLGFKTMTTAEWDVGIVEMGQGDETLGILAHLDVVGIGDRAKWTNDPFTGVQRDGFLWGRGTADDKGGAVMGLYAMKAVQLLGLSMHRKVWLIVGTSEETQWTDIDNFKRQFPVPCCGFTPDGAFPIFNKERGFAEIVLRFFRDGTRGVRKLQGGDSPNTVPSKAEILLNDGRSILSSGVSAHSSLPNEGDNAIIKLCSQLEALGETEFDFVRFISKYLGNSGHAKDLHIDDGCEYVEDGFASITTVAPTVLTLADDGVVLTINIRHKYGTTRENILDAFTALAGEYGYEVSLPEYLDPMRVSKELPLLTIMREVSEEYGVDSSFKGAPGTSYAKSMKNFVSWGPVFPTDPQTAHMEDERLSVNSMLLATRLYGRLISRVAIEIPGKIA
jgi:succinyl-diaminopimelate desuccinylase